MSGGTGVRSVLRTAREDAITTLQKPATLGPLPDPSIGLTLVSRHFLLVGRAFAAFLLLAVAGLTQSLAQAPPTDTTAARDSTGVAPATSASNRALGVSVSHVAVPQQWRWRPTASVLDLLGSGVPGVDLTRAGGAVGIGGRLRIRGAASLLLSPDPAVYVDGVRAEGWGAGESVAFGGSGAKPSRVDDFDPQEIATIEVLKGPAAAALYGADAANGVILIATKGPTRGRRSFELRTATGINWLANPEGRFAPNYYVSRAGTVAEFDVLRFNRTRGFPAVFSNGVPRRIGGSVTGGGDRIGYYLTADAERDEGYLAYDWRNRLHGRANLRYSSANRAFEVALRAGASKAKGRTASGVQPITGSILWACGFPGCEPAAGSDSATTGWNGPGHGYQFQRPEEFGNVSAVDQVSRTTVSLSVQHRPVSWFGHRLTVGPDLVRNRGSLRIDKDPTRNPASVADGITLTTQDEVTHWSVDYAAAAQWRLGGTVAVRTTVGGQRSSRTSASGSGIAPLDGLAETTVTRRSNLTTTGGYLLQQLSWRDRLILTGGLRLSSDEAGGVGLGSHSDPSAGVSWLAVDRPTGSALLSHFRLRAGWGRIGRRPLGLVFASSPNLLPEVTREFEAGFDAHAFDDRLDVEATWYDRRVHNGFELGLTPPLGGLGIAVVNGVELSGRGIELALRGSPVRQLELSLSLSTNHNTIMSRISGIPPSTVEAAAQQWNVVGFAPGSFFVPHVVSATVETTTTGGVSIPRASSALCEGGTDFGRGNGTTVPCAGAPHLYAGRPTPTWFGSATATLTLGPRLHLFGIVDFRGGHRTVVGDVAALHAFFLNSQRALDGLDPILIGYRSLQSDGVAPTGLFKAGFARLRTVSLGYQMPVAIAHWVRASAGMVVIAADNLAFLWREQKTSFGVPWIDPEVVPNTIEDGAGLRRFTQDPLPQPVRIRLTLSLTF